MKRTTSLLQIAVVVALISTGRSARAQVDPDPRSSGVPLDAGQTIVRSGAEGLSLGYQRFVSDLSEFQSGLTSFDSGFRHFEKIVLVPLRLMKPRPEDLPPPVLPPSAEDLKEASCAISVRTLVDGYDYDQAHPAQGKHVARMNWEMDARNAATVVSPAIAAFNAAVSKITPETRNLMRIESTYAGMRSIEETTARRKLIEGLRKDLGPSLGIHALTTVAYCENRDYVHPASQLGELVDVIHGADIPFESDENNHSCIREHHAHLWGAMVQEKRPMAQALASGYAISIDTATGGLVLRTYAENPVETEIRAYRYSEPLQPHQASQYEMDLARLAFTPSQPLTIQESQLWKPLNEPAPTSLTQYLLNSLKRTCGQSSAFKTALRDERQNMNFDKGKPEFMIHTDDLELLEKSGVAR